MRRFVLGLLVLAMALPAVGLSQGPLRRLFQRRTTITVPTQNSSSGTVCVDGVCYPVSSTVSTPSRIRMQPTRSAPVVVGAPVPLAIATEADYAASRPVETAFADTPITTAENTTSFRRSLVQAARKAAGSGEIKRRDALKIRIACFSPAFLESAEDLCVVQMAFSDTAAAEDLPRNASGEIDRTAIDWGGFASFLERILPLILQLFAAFGA